MSKKAVENLGQPNSNSKNCNLQLNHIYQNTILSQMSKVFPKKSFWIIDIKLKWTQLQRVQMCYTLGWFGMSWWKELEKNANDSNNEKQMTATGQTPTGSNHVRTLKVLDNHSFFRCNEETMEKKGFVPEYVPLTNMICALFLDNHTVIANKLW